MEQFQKRMEQARMIAAMTPEEKRKYKEELDSRPVPEIEKHKAQFVAMAAHLILDEVGLPGSTVHAIKLFDVLMTLCSFEADYNAPDSELKKFLKSQER